MATLAVLFPALSLALAFDPCEFFASHDQEVSFDEMLNAAKNSLMRIIQRLARTTAHLPTSAEARDNIWSYLALFDATYGRDMSKHGHSWPTLRWLMGESDAGKWTSGHEVERDESEKGFPAHIELFRMQYVEHEHKLTLPDEKTLDLLARIAIGSPAVTALRSLLRQAPSAKEDGYKHAINAAASIAQGFRSLFNKRWSLRFLRDPDPGYPFWERVLDYCCEGNLQAVMDEYIHLVTDLEGLFDESPSGKFENLADVISSVLCLRAANPKFDSYRTNARGELQSVGNMSIRTHFCLRFGDEREVSGLLDGNRTDVLREAFNSPFRPFVFATTSIGQEGLDFHGYCHSVFHWNLPGNPVDLEQREGRVNRYKGHLIRKNLITDRNVSYMRDRFHAGDDPWELLFEGAWISREKGRSELVPFWVCDGSCRISRHLPLLPFSRERIHYRALKRSLMFYRMAFGQPRQQDLVDYLKSVMVDEPDEEIEEFVRRFMIDLSPK